MAEKMRETSTPPDTLNRSEGNSLQENYELHDVGQLHVRRRLEDIGLTVEEWGIDKREDNESLIFDDKMDLRAHDDVCRGLIEVKTKSNPEWFGVINVRHYAHYLAHSYQFDADAWLWMGLIDENEEVIERDACIPIEPWDQFQRVIEDFDDTEVVEEWTKANIESCPQAQRVFRAPDGNLVVKLDEDSYTDWGSLFYSLGAVR